MPFELGLYLGAKAFGGENHSKKRTLILDKEKYRYQKFISDISGMDIRSHGGDLQQLVRCVRDWLTTSTQTVYPNSVIITERNRVFSAQVTRLVAPRGNRRALSEISYFDFLEHVRHYLATPLS